LKSEKAVAGSDLTQAWERTAKDPSARYGLSRGIELSALHPYWERPENQGFGGCPSGLGRLARLMELPENPSILVLLVATDGAVWLPEVLKGLRAQQYRPIKVLAVDNASGDGSGAILAKAFGVRRIVSLERRIGYGRALAAGLKIAAERRLDADAFLLLHDDAAMAAGAVESMVRTMQSTGAGIVGAKLLEWDNPSLLQDFGQTTDRYGRAVPRVERGDIDQGQHESVEEVLYATSAALLVARELVEKVGLFDTRFVALRDDFDLSWRARIAGFKTVVDPAATVRHASAVHRDLRDSPVRTRTRYFYERNMIATLIKNYSLLRLALALPVTILTSLLNSLLFFVTGRRASAVQVLQALQWNVAHLPSTLRARSRAQRNRAEHDAVVTDLMHHGATRLRAQFEAAVERVVGEVDEGGEDELEKPRPKLRDHVRAHPVGSLLLLALVLGIIGARNLFSSPQLAGIDLLPFPSGVRSFFTTFVSGWRGPVAGGAGPATPGLVVLGVLTFITFGSGWLAQHVLVLGLPLVGALSMHRLGLALGMQDRGRRLAVVAYAASPLMLGAFGGGRLPDLVLLAFAPALLIPLVRAAGIGPGAGWRTVAAGIASLAVATSLAPWAVVFFAGSGVIIAALCAGTRKTTTGDVLKRTVTIVASALVLLLPWSAELFRRGSPLGSGGGDPARGMTDILALSAGPVRALPLALAFGLPIAGLAGLVAAPAQRRRAAAIFAGVAVVSIGLAWAVARGVPWIAPRPELPLIGAAVAWAVLTGIGFDAAASRLRARAFGAAHLVAGVAGIVLLVQIAASAGWIARGDHPGLVESGTLLPSFLTEQASQQGPFRIAWVDGTAAAPLVSLTGPAGRTMLQFLERPAGRSAEDLRRSIAAIASNETESGGRLLATFGVQYVIVRPSAEDALSAAFARQVDLFRSQSFHGGTVYLNEAGLPIATTVSAPGWVQASSSTFASVAGAEASPSAGPALRQTGGTGFKGAAAKNAKEILLAEDYSPEWRAQVDGATLKPQRSFGWATRFVLGAGAQRIAITWSGQRWHRGALVLELLLVVGLAIRWSQRAARERGER
jgi:GT2 family glycosyltransferase